MGGSVKVRLAEKEIVGHVAVVWTGLTLFFF